MRRKLQCRPKNATANHMSEIIFVIEEAPEGGYTACALGVSIVTEADTVEDLRAAIRDAVQCHFEAPMYRESSVSISSAMK
jgi:predicted RNase H-like HicB family nuclease